MQTWIDGYISEMGLLARKEDPSKILTSEMDIQAGGYYSAYVGKQFKRIPLFVLGKLFITLSVTISEDTFDDNYKIFHKLDQITSMFVVPMESVNQIALKINDSLAHTFAFAKAPKVSKSEMGIHENSIVYIDVPSGIISAGDSYVRALFIVSSISVSKVACVLDDGTPEIGTVFTFEYGNTSVPPNANYSHTADDIIDMQKIIENFITLSLLYRTVASESDRTILPRISMKASAKLSAKKANAKHQKNSIFNVHYLRAPKGHFGMRQNQGSHTISGRWDVSGHFRWQPWGAGRLKRKLIWIEGYVKGSGEKHQRLDILN